MTISTTTNLVRKVALGLGAITVSTMILAGTASAKPKFNLQLNFGGGGHGIHGTGYINTWNAPNCWYYWNKYQKTGKWYWKNLYNQCTGAHYH